MTILGSGWAFNCLKSILFFRLKAKFLNENGGAMELYITGIKLTTTQGTIMVHFLLCNFTT